MSARQHVFGVVGQTGKAGSIGVDPAYPVLYRCILQRLPVNFSVIYGQRLKMSNNKLGEQRWIIGSSELPSAYPDSVILFRVVYVLMALCVACPDIFTALVVQSLLTPPVVSIKLVTGFYAVSGKDSVEMSLEVWLLWSVFAMWN